VRTLPTFGFRAVFAAEPVAVSIRRLTRGFVDGHARHHELWRRVLSGGAMSELEWAAGQASETGAGVALKDEQWFTIVYDYLVAYNAREIEAGPLLDSLIPLYFARTATFVERTREDSPEEAEARIEAAVDVAVERKPYLVERWAALKVPARPLRDQPVP